MKAFEDVMKAAQSAIDGKASADQITEMKETSEKIAEDIQKLSKQQDEIQLKMKENARPMVKGYGNEFLKALKNADPRVIKEAGKSFAGQIAGDPWQMMKDAGTIQIDDNLGAFDLDTAVILPMRTPGVEKAPDRRTSILDMMTMATTSSNHVTWIERSARTDGTDTVAEATGQYGQSDFTWVQKKALVEKIGTFIKISNESLEDWPFVISEVRNELMGMLRRSLELQVWSGSGTTPDLDGITNNAVAYSDTGLNTYVSNPTTADAIRAAINQIRGDEFMPNGIILHPTDVAKMQLDKDGNNNYLFPTFFTQDGMRIHGLHVIESTLITAGNLMVGDFSKITVYMRRNMDIRIWDQDSTDPEYDLKTITGSLRATIKFPTTAYAGVVYDAISDITTAIASA